MRPSDDRKKRKNRDRHGQFLHLYLQFRHGPKGAPKGVVRLCRVESAPISLKQDHKNGDGIMQGVS
jgi:hypothetical protein